MTRNEINAAWTELWRRLLLPGPEELRKEDPAAIVPRKSKPARKRNGLRREKTAQQ